MARKFRSWMNTNLKSCVGFCNYDGHYMECITILGSLCELIILVDCGKTRTWCKMSSAT